MPRRLMALSGVMGIENLRFSSGLRRAQWPEECQIFSQLEREAGANAVAFFAVFG